MCLVNSADFLFVYVDLRFIGLPFLLLRVSHSEFLFFPLPEWGCQILLVVTFPSRAFPLSLLAQAVSVLVRGGVLWW